MQNSSKTFFYIDYHEKDRKWAAWIGWQLEANGYTAFVEDWDLQAGQNREQIIQQLLQRDNFIVAVLSPDYDMSDKNSILSFALARDKQNRQNTVLPVRVSECDPQGQLSSLVFIDLVGLDIEEARKRLINWISRERRKPTDAPVLSIIKKDEPLEPAQVHSSLSLLSLWHVPYPSHTYFVGREAIFRDIEATLKVGKIAAIAQPEIMSNEGGIGKTQLAIEYANRHYSSGEYKFVFLAKADSQDIFSWDLLGVAIGLNLPEKDALNRSIAVEAVKRWLADHTDWLFILDNVGEPEIVKDFLSLGNQDDSAPGCRRHILLTTRIQASRNVAQYIELQKLESVEGALLLLRRAGRLPLNAPLDNALEADQMAAQEISEAMQGHPLALEHAGAYIAKTGIDDLSSYLSFYLQRHNSLLQQQNISTSLLPVSVRTTWLLSFRVINSISQKLLFLCAFLYPDAISQETILNCIQDLDLDLPSDTEIDQYQIRAAFSELVDYSLLSRDPRIRTLFTISPLLQMIIRDEMDESTHRRWAEQAIFVVSQAFPVPEFETYQSCKLRIPQARTCLELIAHWHIETLEAAQLLDRVGYYLGYYVQDSHHFAKAELLCKQALDIRKRLLDPHHPDVATSHNHLAVLYRIQGNSELAKQHYQQAQEIWLCLLEVDGANPSLDHLDDLAEFYYMHREYDQAEPLYQQALKICEQIFGVEDPKVVIILNKLAELYSIQGKYALAEPLYQRALTLREQALPPDIVPVIQSLNTLAGLYEAQGDYMQAEPLYHRALARCKETLDPTYVAQSLNNLALFYQTHGKYTQAEIFFKQALETQEQILEPDSLYISQCLNNLASLYRIQGKYDQAEPLYQKALHIHEQTLGLQHPYVGHDLNNLAFLYYSQCKYDQALSNYQRALEIQEQVLGSVHSEVACCLNNLALLYRIQGDYDQALSNYQRALEIQEQVLGKDHYEVANSLNNVAEVYYVQGKYDQVELPCKRALEIQEQTLGKDHLDVARTLKNLAALYRIQNNYAEAERLYKRVQEIYEYVWGSQHLDVAKALNNLAVLYRSQGNQLQVDPLYKRILAIRERSLGSEHLDVANVLNNLAMLYRSQADYEHAEWLYRRVLAIHEQTLGPEHLHMAIVLENYSYLLRKLEREAEAARMEARAREIRVKHANEHLLL